MKKNNEIYREQIGILKNEATHLWGSTFVIGGGALTLFLNYHNFLTGVFGVIGLFFTVLFFKTYLLKRKEMIDILKKMEV